MVVLTQPDSVAIPANIGKIAAMGDVDLAAVIECDAPGAVVNKKRHFAKGFGLTQTVRFGVVLARHRVVDLVDQFAGYRLARQKRSVRAAAVSSEALYLKVTDPNSAESIEHFERLRPDLIVSFSAPCVFKPRLLELAPLGCINLHCSPLPAYAGLLPSFWVLYHGENETAATVHYIDSHIDSGPILGQTRVPIAPGATMFRVVQETKRRGGDLMVETIQRLHRGDCEATPNCPQQRTYFTWPTVEQVSEFRRRGGRLI